MSDAERRCPNTPPFDIQNWMLDDGLPRPKWDLIGAWIDERVAAEHRAEAWTEVERRWLETLGPALGQGYRAIESRNFLFLIDRPNDSVDRFLSFAEECLRSLPALLPGVADFMVTGKHVVLALNDTDDYYRYAEFYHPEGKHGASAGMHIREGHPHIVLNAVDLGAAQSSLAHELTHAALQHLQMPLWMEEGLTQMFEHNAAGRTPLMLDTKMGERHKRYWRRYGLEPFWSGEGFFAPTRLQELCYQLAETLMRLLIEEHRPRWFGLSRGKQDRLIAFLTTAKTHDAGRAAAREHLQFDLDRLVGTFLGPGKWTPQATYDAQDAQPPAALPN